MRVTLSTGEGEGQMQRGGAAGESVTELGERRGGQGQRSGACVDVGGLGHCHPRGATGCLDHGLITA